MSYFKCLSAKNQIDLVHVYLYKVNPLIKLIKSKLLCIFASTVQYVFQWVCQLEVRLTFVQSEDFSCSDDVTLYSHTSFKWWVYPAAWSTSICKWVEKIKKARSIVVGYITLYRVQSSPVILYGTKHRVFCD